MNDFKITIKAKDLRRAAFAVGFGLTVGKAVGNFVGALIEGATTGMIQQMAKHGNGAAKKACEESGIKWDNKNIQNDLKQ